MLTITRLSKSDGGWRTQDLAALPEEADEDALLWVDAENPTQLEIDQLKSHFGLKELDLQKLGEEGRRSRIEEDSDCVSCFVSFPNREHFVSNIKTSWIAITAGKHWLISVHKDHSLVTCEIYRKISAHGYFALSLTPSTDVLIYIFLDLVTNEYFLVSDLIHERLQKLTQEAGSLFREQRRSTRDLGLEISRARDHVLVLRQLIGPLREVVGRIVRGEFAVVSSNTLPRFEDLYDRAISLHDAVDSHREEIHDIGDILINFQTLTTNNIIRVLTIISAIFLPLTLIAGIFGTNFYVPLDAASYGFYVMVAMMIVAAVGLISMFRKKGWL